MNAINPTLRSELDALLDDERQRETGMIPLTDLYGPRPRYLRPTSSPGLAARDAERSMQAAYAEWGAITPFPTPARRLDWDAVGVWVAGIVLCGAVWTGVIVLAWRVATNG